MNKEELKKAIDEVLVKIDEVTEKVNDLEKQINDYEIDPYYHENLYCEALDEQGDVTIGTLSYSPSVVLREVDPTAYRCGLIDFVDSLDNSDDPEYQQLEEELEEAEDELNVLANELDDLESELEELEEEAEE